MEPELGIPVMEHHTTLYEELNYSCETSKLSSWTKHVNYRGTFYSIRFHDKEAILDPKGQVNSLPSTSIKYKPKSRYHITRDHLRMKNFNGNLTETSSIENDTHIDTYSNRPGIYHSATVSTCDQNSNHLSTNAGRELSSLCMTGCSQSMTENHQSNSPSTERDVLTADIHYSPPVQFESCLVMAPLVELQAAVAVSPQVELNLAEIHRQSIREAESLKCPSPPTVVILPNPRANLPSPIVPHSKINLEHTIDSISPTTPAYSSYVDYAQTSTEGYVPKFMSDSDILCNICSAIAPNDTNMLYCDHCHLHLCGNCLLASSYDHSIHCPNVLRYMRSDEKHLQYVPDSKDSSIVSDSPAYESNSDAVVPKLTHFEQTKAKFFEWARPLLDSFTVQMLNKQFERSDNHDPGG